MVHIWPSPRLTLVCRVCCRSLLQGLGQPTRVGADESCGGWDRVEVHRGRHAIARPDHRGEVRVQYDAGRVVCALGPPEA